MNYRTAKILAETNYDTAQTKTFDINISDVISRIILAWRVTKGQNGMAAPVCNDISKIELVDGSEVLHSLNGGENQALCIYDRKCPTMNHGQHINASSEYSTYGLDFGRFLFDPVLALDPKLFKNLQLKVTFNFAIADTLSSSGNLEIWAECFDGKVVTPIGMLVAKEHYDWSIAAAGAYEYIDLPTDRVLRKLLIQGYRLAYEPWYQVLEARLDEDNEKRIPFDWDLEDYSRVMKGIWTPVTEGFQATITTDSPYYVTPTDYWVELVTMPSNTDYYARGSAAEHRGGYFVLDGVGGACEISGLVRGYLPNHCYEFPFGDQKDMDDWYDVTKLGSLRLRLKSGSGTSGNGRVVLQSLRKY